MTTGTTTCPTARCRRRSRSAPPALPRLWSAPGSLSRRRNSRRASGQRHHSLRSGLPGDGGRGPGDRADSTSYTNDIYPILQRARDTRWVETTWLAHRGLIRSPRQAMRDAIFNRLSVPGGGSSDMPDLNDSGTGDNRLTPPSTHHMQRWKDDGNYTNDWAGVPRRKRTSHQMDWIAQRSRIASGAPSSGYRGRRTSADNARPIIDATKYLEAFRLDHADVAAGGITAEMALPWQADFNACGDNWWPVPRPERSHSAGAKQLGRAGRATSADTRTWSPNGTRSASSFRRATSTSRWIAATRQRSRC